MDDFPEEARAAERENGALVQQDPVVVDGQIITGSGPQAAGGFAEVMLKSLSAPAKR